MAGALDRKLNSLEALLLFFLQNGLTSAYELMSQAGMSPGLTGPALRRMETAGLITRNPGPRNASRFTISPQGSELLSETLKLYRMRNWFPESHSVFESTPRALLMAWVFGEESEIEACVAWAASALVTRRRSKLREAKDLEITMSELRTRIANSGSDAEKGALIAASYRWLKATLDSLLLNQQVKMLPRAIGLVKNLPLAIRSPIDNKGTKSSTTIVTPKKSRAAKRAVE